MYKLFILFFTFRPIYFFDLLCGDSPIVDDQHMWGKVVVTFLY